MKNEKKWKSEIFWKWKTVKKWKKNIGLITDKISKNHENGKNREKVICKEKAIKKNWKKWIKKHHYLRGTCFVLGLRRKQGETWKNPP